MKTRRFLSKIMFFGLVFMLCARPVGPARAAGFLQTEINNACDGCTVTIQAGTYTETLTVNKNITLTGASMATTILQPMYSTDRVITVTAGHNLTLNHLTVTGGHPDTAVPTPGAGGGVYLADGDLTLYDCRITNNSATYGGGIFQDNPPPPAVPRTVTASSSYFESNTATQTGGGLYVRGSAMLTNTNLTSNTAAMHGGGMHVAGVNTTVLIGGVISGNHAGLNGGGVNLDNGLTISGTQFTNNTAGNSGGGLTQWNSGKPVSINNTTFTGNTALYKGGGAFVGSHLTITATTFNTNSVDSLNNTNTSGGGLHANGGLDGSQLTFSGNIVKCKLCAASTGGGLYIYSLAANTASSITQSTFDRNSGWSGAGIFSDYNILLTLTNSTFTNNSGGYGGGVDAAHLQGDRLMFQNNTVVNGGGGASVTSGTVTNSRFIGNSASYSGGGGILVVNDFIGTNLLFVQNSSPDGAAMAVLHGPATLRYATIVGPGLPNTQPAIKFKPPVPTSLPTMNINNTIISSYGTAVAVDGALTEDYNLFYNNTNNFTSTSVSSVTSGGHSLTGLDPLFLSPATGNYHIPAASPAVRKGVDLGVPTDLDGVTRATPPDIGAYQAWRACYLPMIVR